MFTDKDVIKFEEIKKKQFEYQGNIQKEYEKCMEKLRQNNGLSTVCSTKPDLLSRMLGRDGDNEKMQQSLLDLIKQKESFVNGRIETTSASRSGFHEYKQLTVWIIENDD
jgi:hypothetical protein